MTLKIAHLTTLHPRDDVRIFHKEVKTLDNFGLSNIFLFVYDGKKSSKIGNINIINIGKPYSNRLFRFIFGSYLIFTFCKKYSIKIVHFHDPELMLISLLLKNVMGIKVIYDVHENVPQQILSKKWINPILRYPISKLFIFVEYICVHFFELVVVATPSISLRYPNQKTVVIQNFPVVEHVPATSCVSNGGNIFLYVGGISIERGIGEVIRALSYDERLKLQLVGKFDSLSTLDFVKSLNGWSNVECVDWVARNNLPPFFSRAVAGIVTFHPIPNHIHSQPNKLFEYMEAGLPVIASNFPLWRQIIEKYDCGILVDPLNPLEISDAMRWILDHPEEAIKMGARGREAVLREFNWDAESLKLTECYERLIAAC